MFAKILRLLIGALLMALGVVGLLIEIGGVQGGVSIGDHCAIVGRNGRHVGCEIIGFRRGRALALPFGSLDGIGQGCGVEVNATDPMVFPDNGWLGRVAAG